MTAQTEIQTACEGYDFKAEENRYEYADVVVGMNRLNRGSARIEITGEMMNDHLADFPDIEPRAYASCSRAAFSAECCMHVEYRFAGLMREYGADAGDFMDAFNGV